MVLLLCTSDVNINKFYQHYYVVITIQKHPLLNREKNWQLLTKKWMRKSKYEVQSSVSRGNIQNMLEHIR